MSVFAFFLSFFANKFSHEWVDVLMDSRWRDYTEMYCEVSCSLLPVLPVVHSACVCPCVCVCDGQDISCMGCVSQVIVSDDSVVQSPPSYLPTLPPSALNDLHARQRVVVAWHAACAMPVLTPRLQTIVWKMRVRLHLLLLSTSILRFRH